jgi:putative membrane-bound dehydrogenase-like protein
MSRLNVQALPNSLQWGLDHRIYGATGPNGGRMTSPDGAFTDTVDLRGRDFAFDPRTLRLEAIAGGGQHGMSFDNGGRRYATSNSRHLMAFVFDERYLGRNPFLQPTASLVDIPTDGPAAEVFRLSPEEPWRVVRTRWRVAGIVEGPIEGGGRASGYFTGATGGTIYRGNAFPPGFVGDAFIGDAGGNLVHHKHVDAADIEPVATRPPDEVGMEFVASRDTWFRPVQFANAPDGTLYVVDMYRETIEHPWSLPENLKKHLDLDSGNDRGRIYRIVPDGFRQPAPVRLGSADTTTLVATLAHPNGWHRDTAARLLVERKDKSAGPALARLLADSEQPLARLHSLHVLEDMGLLTDPQLVGALRDLDADVRRHALALAEKRIASEPIRTAIAHMASEKDPRFRLQLACTLGELPADEAVGPLAELASIEAANRWVRFAIQSTSPLHQTRLFQALTKSQKSFPGRESLFAGLLRTIGAASPQDQLDALLPAIRHLDQLPLWQALDAGLAISGKSLAGVLEVSELDSLGTKAESSAKDPTRDDSHRLAALKLLGRLRGDSSTSAFIAAAQSGSSIAVQIEAIRQLLGQRSAQGVDTVLDLLPKQNMTARSGAIDALISRPESARRLLEAVESGKVEANWIGRLQRQSLVRSKDAAVAALATKVLGPASSSTRETVLAAFQPSIALPGQADAGRRIYLDRCSQCHRADGAGTAVGPDLVTVKNAGREKLLVAILDPSREVAPQFSRWSAEESDGENHTGIVVSETPTMVSLRSGGGQEVTLRRENLATFRNEDSSLMPDDLQAGLEPKDLADLLRFIEAVTR